MAKHGALQRGAIDLAARNSARLTSHGNERDLFTHRGLADCHAVITLPSGDALAEELHVSTATLDGAASTAAISTSRSISITINHSVVAAATDTQPLKSRKFPDGGWAVFLALLELELGWNVAEVKMPQ